MNCPPALTKVHLICGCLLLMLAGVSGTAAQVSGAAPSTPVERAPAAAEKAWEILKAGLADPNTEKHAIAVRVLGLVPHNAQALQLAEHALANEKPEIRAAAAMALGQMRARQAIPKLRRALNDTDTSVVLAAANSLRSLRDPAAYRVYYAVLTGERKAGRNFIKEQEKTLRDPKKLALFGFEEGIGQIPFAGIGYHAIKAVTKDDTSPVRAAAAKALAKDRDPQAGEALAAAASDKSWIVRAAALDAIAERGDPALLPKVVNAMTDEKDAVRLTAAATVVHLSAITEKRAKTVAGNL
jgi:HEAT repeat protein